MKEILSLALLICLGQQVLATSLPSYIHPCPKNENFNNCALLNGRQAISHILQGDSEYGIPILDPWLHRDITASPAGLTITVRNLTTIGFSNGTLESVNADFGKKKITIDFRAPKLKFEANYTMNGTLIGVNVNGGGRSWARAYDVILRYSTTFSTYVKDEKEYGIPVNYEMRFLPRMLKFKLLDLFEDEHINNRVNKFFNKNWRIFMQQAGDSVTQIMGRPLNDILTDLGNKIPTKELFSH